MAVKTAPKSAERSRSPKKGKSAVWKWIKRSIFGVFLIILMAIPIAYYAFWVPQQEWARKLVANIDTAFSEGATQPSVIVASDGTVLYRAIAEYRKPVKFPDIPKVVIDATLAAEDERFYEHPGVDLRSAFRALLTNAREGRTAQGASTITMQVAKELQKNRAKVAMRKLRDIALAMEIEKVKTKDEILKLYLNHAYYGAGAYGVSAAAQVYFGKPLDKITLSEAAMLARLVQRPSEYNPFHNFDLALEKRDLVLGKMLELGKIDESEYQAALKEEIKLNRNYLRVGERILRSPYFVNYVLDTIRRTHPEVDVSEGGFRIETTINPAYQKFAEEAVRDVVRRYRRAGVTTGAFVCMDYEGKILAMVGGVDYSRNQYNVIAQGRRQPGSAMKPFVYAAALSTGALAFHESVSNEPHYIRTANGMKLWPKGGGKGGSVSIRTALSKSINVPAAWVMDKVTPHVAANYCRDVFGFDSPLDPVPSLVLGASAVNPIELAEAYSVFMLYGNRAKAFGIKRIICPDGTVIDDFGPKITENVLDPAVCAFIDECLRAVVTSGTATKARVIPHARGKTGTTQENRDAWFCGYVNNLVGIGWIANEQIVNKRPVYRVMSGNTYGGTVTVDIWVEFMRKVMRTYDDSRVHVKAGMRPAPYTEADVEKVQPEPEVEPEPPPEEDDGFGEPLELPTGEPKVKPETDLPQAPVSPSNRDPKVPTTEPPAERESETIMVELCVETGLRATPYCPETVTRRVSRTGVPTRCRAHGP